MSARVGVDVGGTFTDVVVSGARGLTVWKLPSTPEDQSEAFARGVATALEHAGEPAASSIAHGTTVATNAVLERRGAAVALITTDGFRDVLVIGRQQRPSLYDLTAVRPEPLVPRERAFAVPGRAGPGGGTVVPLDEDAVREAVRAAAAAGAESLAVCLLFSYAAPDAERRIRAIAAEEAPALRVSLSCEVLPEVREYERASTTALDAYVGPVVERYVERLGAAAGGVPVSVMRSGGGTMSAARAAREPVHTLLSGPAAGVRGAAAVAAAAGVSDAISFDMGGTSTDVCLIEEGVPAVAAEAEIGGLPFRTPSLGVHTVGAGGGSILWRDAAGALRAGPHSAGAFPGPACYGRGGEEATVTDAHAILGHIVPDAFLGGRMRLDVPAARAALERLAAALGAAAEEAAAAGLAAVRAAMAAAVRVVSVERGRDPRSLALVAFGGAGPMHATALAADMEIATVLIPPAAGALSALGLLAAPLTADAARTRIVPAGEAAGAEDLFAALEREAVEALGEQGAEPASVERLADCRYAGQAHEITVGAADYAGIAAAFEEAHRRRFGWDAPGEPVELVTARARATGPLPRAALPEAPPGTGARPDRTVQAWIDGAASPVPSIARAALGAGDRIRGPLLVRADEFTAVVGDGWDGEVTRHGTIVLGRR